ncbi:hypothetical protein GCM10027268_06280 [Brachybacterium huguangmaarense]
MLWEPADPVATLRDRFGLPDAAAAASWIAWTVSEGWDLDVERCDRIVMSDANALAWLSTSRGPRIVKWSVAPGRFPRLAAVARVVSALEGGPVPVSAPIRDREGRPQRETEGVSIGLQHPMPGRILDVDDPHQVRAAGATLGRLHRELVRIAPIEPALDPDGPVPGMRSRILTWLEQDREHLPAAWIDALRAMLPGAEPDTAPQLLHGDVRSTNLLWADGDVRGVLDLEEARVDHRLDELGRSAALLGTGFRQWEPITPAVRSEFLASYEAENPLSEAEAALLPAVALWYCLALVPSSGEGSSWWRAAEAELAARV